jgi:DNA-directed RNA polymerase subunit RPC12/RpoP
MFRFTIRDVLWLTVVVALGVGWWAEFRARREADIRYAAARQAIQQTADLLEAEIVESNGQFELRENRRYVGCPDCESKLRVDDRAVQVKTHNGEGKQVFAWGMSAKCVGCGRQFVYVLTPEDVPGYMIWTEQ